MGSDGAKQMPRPTFNHHQQHLATIRARVLQSVAADVLMRDAPESIRPAPEPSPRARCLLLGVGKASLAMADGLLAAGISPDAGVLLCPPGSMRARKPESPLADAGIRVLEADHPLPTQRNAEHARAALELLRSATENDLVIALISGGGSAHLTLPRPGISLEDLRGVTDAMLRSAAPIEAINTVRKHCELLKGGGVLRACRAARIDSFILSDVVSAGLDAVASGPTCADPTTTADALEALARYAPRSPAAQRISAQLRKPDHEETLKPGDPALARVRNTLIGDNNTAIDAAVTAAQSLGFHPVHVERAVTGEARKVGKRIASLAVEKLNTARKPLCIVSGGETTVHVRGRGTGGRNQELALAAAIALDQATRNTTQPPRGNVAVMTLATDGADGPTDHAGAIVTEQTCADARAAALDPHAALTDNDSATLLSALNATLRTGPTQTNVADITTTLIYPATATYS